MQEEKEAQWDRLFRDHQDITDVLDYPIDPGILETVVALNALGFVTIASCEGHLDHGTGAPWIDIEAPHVEEVRVHLAKARKATSLQAKSFLEEQEQAIGRKSRMVRIQLMTYLDRFYLNRHAVAYDQRLVIQGIVIDDISVFSRLESQGAGLFSFSAPEERRQKLHGYQEEMFAFGKFLRQMYFGKERILQVKTETC